MRVLGLCASLTVGALFGTVVVWPQSDQRVIIKPRSPTALRARKNRPRHKSSHNHRFVRYHAYNHVPEQTPESWSLTESAPSTHTNSSRLKSTAGFSPDHGSDSVASSVTQKEHKAAAMPSMTVVHRCSGCSDYPVKVFKCSTREARLIYQM